MSAGEPPARVRRPVFAAYAAGSVGTGGFGVLPGLVLAYYLTDTLGVAALVAAAVVLLPKLIDIAVNPLIGTRSDHARRTRGRRSGGMLVGAVALAPLFVLTFCARPGWPEWVGAIWVLVFFSLAAVAYALFQVPYVALPAELTGDYHERTRLVAARIAVLAVTILLVGAGAPAIRDAIGGTAGYLVMAVAAGVVISGGMLAATLGAARRSGTAERAEGAAEHGYRHAVQAWRTSRRFRALLAVYVVQALASAVMLAAAQYVATYVLDDSGALTLLFVALVAPAIVVMPAWYRFGHRYGKERGLLAASAFFIVGSAALLPAAAGPGGWMLAAVAVAGVGYAGMQTFPLALLPDVIDEYSAQAGEDRGGAMSGLWTAGETVGLAIGPAAFLGILGATGFVSSTGDEHADQPTTALVGIVTGFSAVPALLVATGVVILIRGFGLHPPTRTAPESAPDAVPQRPVTKGSRP
ncbi:MFS transporter [Gordonia sp. ABSL1-1]|uniref:MFS transporter n=1 Tax=Gordonia sp. ABSL1-1 TaxID=3053923 RepID=UPI0025737676|nr:MFS transporter [Gordonia sp. ABSL1-1]MDL9935717.1 MFS transporter [Gordonia sp. ABSL1-1]